MSNRKKSGMISGVSYQRKGECIEVRLVDNYRVTETQQFKIHDAKDNDRFFEYVCDKLGFDFKRYKKNKLIEWQ